MEVDELTEMRADIFEPLLQSDLPIGKVIVVGGAALQIHGVLRTTDIDLVMQPGSTADFVDWLDRRAPRSRRRGTSHGEIVIPEMGARFYRSDEYATYGYGVLSLMDPPNDELYAASYEELLADSSQIGPAQVLSIEGVLRWKQAIVRPKDIFAINRIQDFLAKREQQVGAES